MTTKEFNIAFMPFLDYFPEGQEMSKEKLNIYCLALSFLTPEQLNEAFINMVRDRVYKSFPQVAEIIQYATGTNEKTITSRIVIAKEQLKKAIATLGSYQSIQFEDLGIHAVIDSLGGWQKLCSMTEAEFKKFLSFDFADIYETFIKNPYKVNSHYIGFFDQSNRTLKINYISKNGDRQILIGSCKSETLLENKNLRGNGLVGIKNLIN